MQRPFHDLARDGHPFGRRVPINDGVRHGDHLDDRPVGQHVERVARAIQQAGLRIKGVVRDEDGNVEATEHLLGRDHRHVGQRALRDGELAAHGL